MNNLASTFDAQRHYTAVLTEVDPAHRTAGLRRGTAA